MDFREFLKRYKAPGISWPSREQQHVKDLPLPKALVTLKQSQDGLFSAIQALSEHHLLSAPVVDDDGKLVTILDTLDIAAYIVEMEAAGKKALSDEKLEKLLGRCKNRTSCVTAEEGLDKVVESILGEGRRAVVLSEGKPESIITHSTVVTFFNSKLKEIEALVAPKMAQDICTPRVVTIHDHATALTAFQTLVAQGLSSLIITDDSGAAITVVSATDLVMALGHEDDKSAILSELRDRNVVFFVGDSRKPDRHFSHTRAPIISVSNETPMSMVIEKFATTRVHRMLVVPAGSRKPAGVLSLLDICKGLTSGA
ncbi:unnamed protein product [Effrenium voratum]|nr:unnamed protein product [Effrenium voratum]